MSPHSFFQNRDLHSLFSLSTEWPHAPGIWDEKHVSGWKDITDAVHNAGGKIYAQVS
jgi:2,4-dienoyl-CoA reductase-like NADH-dependent reductase (Old Yellow Enzyme family)